MSSIRWLTIESNPEVMNKFLESLGVPPTWGISDVISLDDELISMIPTPSLAFLLLFPVSEAHEEYRKRKVEESKSAESSTAHPYFMKQTIRNACGTVALLHALANNIEELKVDESSALHKFFATTKDLSPEDRGKHLETDENIGVAHESSAMQGQTEVPPLDVNVNLHFIAFVNVDGTLYELDGRNEAPIIHGKTSPGSFIKDASKVCKEFMQRDPENVNFTILTLGPGGQ